jgi:glucuronate isomerase
MSDEEFEKWAESLPDVDDMSTEEFANWLEAVRSRPDSK